MCLQAILLLSLKHFKIHFKHDLISKAKC
uniref:Uncharacterized protein n=1 Tax=Anguilla anguilla TaxID=7936 RepID=A0A0E9UBP4_ANGAN